ncbi:MAG: hypothetical protein QXV17_03700 [Candidatus Micrarchaeaceae archaeon]
MIYKSLEIDGKTASKLNKEYYSENVELGFRTKAMYDRRYPKVLGSIIYNLIDNNYRGKPGINALEIGARGIYFEKRFYDEISLNDSKEGTDYAKRIRYIVLDLSKVAMENAKVEYAGLHGSCFNTEFIVGDALTAKLPKNIDIVIMNELLDDLQQMVVTKKDGRLYEMTFKMALDSGIDSWIKLQRKRLRPLEYGNAGYLKDISEMLGEGQAITFSPVIDKLFNNIASVSNEESHLIIHDYFVTGSISAKYAPSLKRVYGRDDPSIIFVGNVSDGLLQVTSDVNLHQVLDVLSRNGYAAYTIENYDLFIDEALGHRYIYTDALAFAINALDTSAKKDLLKRLGGPELEENASNGQTCAALVEKLNSIFPGRFKLKQTKIFGFAGKFDIDVRKDERLDVLYEVYRNSYAMANPFMNIAAVKVEPFKSLKRY